jgi:hypothetical protein
VDGKVGIVERYLVDVQPGIQVPMIVLSPTTVRQGRPPAVIAIAQSGKEGFLHHRADEIAELLAGGVAVVLPDLRGTGETRSGDDRGRQSADTSRSSTEQMLGGTMLGARLRDLRAVIACLRSDFVSLDAKRLAIWGDSFAEPNAASANFHVPHGVEGRPRNAEPLGGFLALLTALYEEDIQGVYVRGGLTSFQSTLESKFMHIPHDVIVPGMLTIGDLSTLAASLAPLPVRLEGLVDGLNRPAPSSSASRKSAASWLRALN